MTYDEFTSFWLRQRPEYGEEESDIPMVAHLCLDCGSVAVDTAVHDRWHETVVPPVKDVPHDDH